MIILIALKTRVKSFSQFKCFYTKLRILISEIEPFKYIYTYVWLAIPFWLQVVLSCIAIGGEEKVHPALMYLVYLCTLIMSIFNLALVPVITKAAATCVEVVAMQRKLAMGRWETRKSFGDKVNIREAVAMAPVQWTYGPFLRIGKGFEIVHLSRLLGRIFDMCLILQL